MAGSKQLEMPSWTVAAQRAPGWAILGAAALVLLVAVSAQIAVPLPGTPVPVTLQDITVLSVGLVLGPVGGALTVASYVLLGAAGAPVFSNGMGGLPWLMGPTGGYLLAFPVAAFLVGWATRPSKPWWMLPLGLVAAQAAVFTLGVLQLALVTGMGLQAAVTAGLIPFLPGVAVKGAIFLAFAAGFLRWRQGRGEAAAD